MPPASSPQGRALFERILDSPIREPRPARSRRRRLALVLVPIALAAGLAAGYEWLRPARNPIQVACFDDPSLRASREVRPVTGADVTATCVELWLSGGRFAPAGGGAVPPLAPCILPGGAVGVFPVRGGADPCGALGLAQLQESEDPEGAIALAELQESLATHFVNDCVSESDALAFVQGELGRLGLAPTWTVKPLRPFTSREPCAGPSYDFLTHTVLLSPVRNTSTP